MTDTRQVVGIQYEPGQTVPVVILKGTGETAEHILREAKTQPALQVVRDPELVKQLYRVPIDGPIGAELFPVMATLLIQVLELDRRNVENDR